MRLTSDQVKNLPDGTELVVFYSGSEWDDDFAKVYKVIKLGNKLYHYSSYNEINDIDDTEGYEIDVVIK